MSSSSQSFENHSQRPILYLFTGALFVITLCFFGYVTVKNFNYDGVFAILNCIALLLLWYLTRVYALKNQDRIIRLEMIYRLEKILPKERHSDISKLKLGQLIALRFASDAELPDLFEQVVSGKLEKREEIKRAIKNWQPDLHRV